jgi:hypothetical protein
MEPHYHVGGVPPVPKAFQAKKSLTVLQRRVSWRVHRDKQQARQPTDHAIPRTVAAQRDVSTGRDDAEMVRRSTIVTIFDVQNDAARLRTEEVLLVGGERAAMDVARDRLFRARWGDP